MYRSAIQPMSEYEAAMPTHILWVVFYDFAIHNRCTYVTRRYHPLGPRHLPNGMWQE